MIENWTANDDSWRGFMKRDYINDNGWDDDADDEDYDDDDDEEEGDDDD